MTISTGHATIGTVATLIDGTSNSDFRLTIHNADNTDVIYIGGSDVTPSNGLGIQKEETLQFDLYPMERIYAVSTKAGHIIHWLKQV